MTEIKVPIKATYALAKAMLHANATSFYLDLLVTESGATMQSKLFLKSLAAKAASINQDIKFKVGSREMKEMIESEMKDPLALDALQDVFITLNLSNREKAEMFITELLDKQTQTK